MSFFYFFIICILIFFLFFNFFSFNLFDPYFLDKCFYNRSNNDKA